jgi:hypothetical protein
LVSMETTASDTAALWRQCVWPICYLQSPWSGPPRRSLYRYGGKWYLGFKEYAHDSSWKIVADFLVAPYWKRMAMF